MRKPHTTRIGVFTSSVRMLQRTMKCGLAVFIRQPRDLGDTSVDGHLSKLPNRS